MTTDLPPDLGLSNAHTSTPGYLPCLFSPSGRFLQLRDPQPGSLPCHQTTRGEVREFSRQARKRMMQYFATIDEEVVAVRCCFITLTYHNDWGDGARDWHDDLNTFLTWLCRSYPKAGVVWRLEFQDRGAPHWHLLVVNAPHIPYADVTREWAGIAHEHSIYHGEYATKVEGVKSWRQACFYIGKYVAKVNDCPNRLPTGRCWGVRRAECIPTSVKCEMLPLRAWRTVYSAMLAIMPEKVRAIYTKYPQRGVWSMLPRQTVDDLLRYALGQVDISPPD